MVIVVVDDRLSIARVLVLLLISRVGVVGH